MRKLGGEELTVWCGFLVSGYEGLRVLGQSAFSLWVVVWVLVGFNNPATAMYTQATDISPKNKT